MKLSQRYLDSDNDLVDLHFGVANLVKQKGKYNPNLKVAKTFLLTL